MFLEIDINNKINQKEKNFLEITNDNNNLYIYGEIEGFFENKNFFNKEETISVLKSNLHDIDKFKKFVLIFYIHSLKIEFKKMFAGGILN